MAQGTKAERRATQDPRPGSVRFVTFGCKANQYDTQVLREALRRRGLVEVGAADGGTGRPREPDLVAVNTCTVTAEAGRKARQLARRIARDAPRAKIAMTGCLAESEPEILAELLRELPGAAPRDAAGRWEEGFRRELDGAHDGVVLEGFVGLSGRYQRVLVSPDRVEGVPPAAIDVRLVAEAAVDPDGRRRTRLTGVPIRDTRAASAAGARP